MKINILSQIKSFSSVDLIQHINFDSRGTTRRCDAQRNKLEMWVKTMTWIWCSDCLVNRKKCQHLKKNYIFPLEETKFSESKNEMKLLTS